MAPWTTERTARVESRRRSEVSKRMKIADMSKRFVPSKRNLLDKASAAQNLDGNRLTGSLLTPVAEL
jgi:hypothetical protein